MYKVTCTSSKWGYREIVKEQEEEPVEQGDQDERTSGK